jgi:hypothetical protein
VKAEEILKIIPPTRHPVGLTGCYVEQSNFDCCAYDIIIFDGKDEHESLIEKEGHFFNIHHSTLSENNAESLIQFQNMKILSDEQWELQMFLAKINKKQESIFNVFTKNSIIESQICLTKAKNGIDSSDPFTSSWIKCAAYFLTDAIISLNKHRPSPSHMLGILRNLKSNQTNETLSIVLNSLGLERSTPSLLKRMAKSAIGLSDLVGKNNSKIIQHKTNYFIEKSLLSDCYFYIGYENRNNFYRVKNSLDAYPEMIHILKVGFDLEHDISTFDKDIQSLTNVIQILLKSTHN